NGIIFDIAARDSQTVFAVTDANRLLKIHLDSGTVELIDTLVQGIYTSLYYHPDGELYSIDNSTGVFVRIDPENGDLIDSQAFNQFSPGDLTYFQGNLIFPGADLDVFTYDQINAPFKVGCTDAQLFGLANYFEGCDQNTIWAFDGVAQVFAYDVASNTFNFLGDLFSQTSNLFGATTVNETQAGLCVPQFIPGVSCTVSTLNLAEPAVSVFPNPSGRWLNIEVPFDMRQAFIQLVNDQGQIVQVFQDQDRLDLQDLSPGLYFLTITDQQNGDQWHAKVVLIP
ncbi:MAG: T9SS type A sorting domain-containing protein, partial [Bacteroidota bacterium]